MRVTDSEKVSSQHLLRPNEGVKWGRSWFASLGTNLILDK